MNKCLLFKIIEMELMKKKDLKMWIIYPQNLSTLFAVVEISKKLISIVN